MQQLAMLRPQPSNKWAAISALVASLGILLISMDLRFISFHSGNAAYRLFSEFNSGALAVLTVFVIPSFDTHRSRHLGCPYPQKTTGVVPKYQPVNPFIYILNS